MTKQAERAYLANLGEDGRNHSKFKPFSNHDCGLTLASIGTVMHLMPPRPARVLDMGCGGGWTSIFFARHGYEVVGQDIAPDMIDLANEAKAETGLGDTLSFIVSDYESLGFADEFDCVVFFDCLHHADDEVAALRSAYAALRPGGLLITHEPGDGHAHAPASIEAMAQYGVNERDMPPRLIIAQGEAIGFRAPRIYPVQHLLFNLYFGAPAPRLFSWAGLRLARRLLRLAFSPNPGESAIVVMRKPG